MFIVLRNRSIKRTLALAVLLIMVGLSMVKPPTASAESNLAYLYPTKTNNPVEQTGYFWLEAHPEWGSLTLPEWATIIRNQEIVVGVPEHYLMGSTMVGDKLGRFIVNKIRGKTGKADKDVFIYNRKIFRDGIEEEIKVEVGKHFRDNDNFRKFVDAVKDGLVTDPDEVKKIPAKTPTSEEQQAQAAMLGNTLILGGLAMLARVAYTVATRTPPPF